MGFPDMAAVQLLWTRLHCLCCCWKGITMKFGYTFENAYPSVILHMPFLEEY